MARRRAPAPRRKISGARTRGLKREYVATRPWHAARAYSSAVKVTGGTLVFVAGMTPVDEQRRLIGEGDFDRQVAQVWDNIELALKAAGGTLADIVTMTVFITDMRHGNRFVELRRQKFGKDFPASALIGIKELAMPGMLIEIQVIAAIS